MIYLIVCGLLVLVIGGLHFKSARFTSVSNKGVVACKAGRLDEAERFLQQTFQMTEKMRDRPDCQMVAWLHLSLIAVKRKQPEEAIRCVARSLEAMGRVKCGDTRNFHRVFRHIAEVLEENGEFDDAIRFRRLKVQAMPAQTAHEATMVTGSLIQLARALKDADRPAEAVTAYESVLKLPQSTNIPHARMEMADVLKKVGRFDEAEQQHQQAIEVFRKSGAKEEVNLAVSLSNCGVFYGDRARFEDALTVYRESLEIRRRLLGRTSVRYAVTENNMGNCLRQLGRLEEAAVRAMASVAVLRSKTHQALPNAIDTLGLVMRDSGNLREAEVHLAEACGLLKKMPNRDSQDYAMFSEHHAEVLEQLNCYPEAAAAREQAQTVNDARKTTRTLAAMLDSVPVGFESA